MAKGKKTLGSVRAKAGLPAKAGRRRGSHIKKDAQGSYQNVAGGVSVQNKPNFNIFSKKYNDDIIKDSDTRERILEVALNRAALKEPKGRQLMTEARAMLAKLAGEYRSDPFFFARKWKDFINGYIGIQEIKKGKF